MLDIEITFAREGRLGARMIRMRALRPSHLSALRTVGKTVKTMDLVKMGENRNTLV